MDGNVADFIFVDADLLFLFNDAAGDDGNLKGQGIFRFYHF